MPITSRFSCTGSAAFHAPESRRLAYLDSRVRGNDENGWILTFYETVKTYLLRSLPDTARRPPKRKIPENMAR